MTAAICVPGLLLTGCLLGGCGGGPTVPDAVSVAGTWDATFEGIVQGVVLKRNNLAETGMLRAGRSEAAWRSEFLSMQARLEFAEEALDDVPNSRARRRDTFRQQLAELHRQYRILEDEADDAHVPFAWRY